MATKKKNLQPDYLFEVSWEVCNKVGGIYTVIATKALYLQSQLGRHHIFIGPDVWMHRAGNPDFLEDPLLYRSWRAQAQSEGLRFRVGRWNIPGKPIAILVDYKHLLPQADDILTGFWKDFGVDSISGNWDYKESAVFGYAAGLVIESFWNYNVESGEKAVAQFHEWQTGAGILQIKRSGIPVATAFTTHATMMGRCLAGNNLPLYDQLGTYNADEMARRFNVVAIHSLEKTSALNADVFTTVSEITARECAQFHGREVDVVTPNGFENSFTPASDEEYQSLHDAARARLQEVASAMSAEPVPSNAIYIGIGGRYAYRNKGIDVFIDALDKLNRSDYDGRSIQAFIMIPAGHHGPDKELAAKLFDGGRPDYQTQTSHYLMNAEYDMITRRLREIGLNNAIGDKVKVYFIPSYLNGDDGIFNMRYYDLLCGLDLALFPSYYEPWGYTPLEALAFRVPTLTTTLAGFGKWVLSHYGKAHPGITVLERNDSNSEEVVEGVASRIKEVSGLELEERNKYRENAREVAQIALWEHQIVYYQEAYSIALAKVQEHAASYKSKKDKTMQYFKPDVTNPSWRSILVTRHLPEKLSRLEKLSKNLWWCWNESAKDLFRSIDPEVWHQSGHNPLVVLDTVSI